MPVSHIRVTTTMIEKEGPHFIGHQAVSSNNINVNTEPTLSKHLHLSNPSDSSATTIETTENDAGQHITGIKLWLLMASISLVCFLMLLDMSIIVTVGVLALPHAFSIVFLQL